MPWARDRQGFQPFRWTRLSVRPARRGERGSTSHTMQKSSTYNYSVEPFSEDYCGNLSWGNLGNLILRCASLHAGERGFGYSQMIALHHAWVLSRLVIEMDQAPRTADAFTIETWVDKLYRQFTDRHFSICRPDGTPFGHATSTWALIDTGTRLPADLERLPDGGFTSSLIPDRPSPIAPMGRIRLKSPQLVATHKAVYSDLDINGHVNSIRYLEMLIDHFTAEQLRATPIRRVEMAYCLEAYCGDTLDIYHDLDPKNPSRHLFEIRNAAAVVVRGSVQF